MLNKSLVFLALTFTAIPVVNAETISFSTGPFDHSVEIFDGMTFDMPTSVTGLQKFDASLGTLTGVSFAFTSGTFDWSIEMFAEPMDEVDFDVEYSAAIQADLTYISGVFGNVLTGVSDGTDLFCSGTSGDGDDCFDSNSNFLNMTDGFQVPRPLSDFNLADIVGVGDVANLQLSINLFDDSLFTSGIDFIDISGSAMITRADIEVTYEYSAVPVPASIWLLGSGLVGLIGFARRK